MPPNNRKEKIKKVLYYVFITIGILGLIDIATRGLVQEAYSLSDSSEIGYIVVGFNSLFSFLFGTKIAISITSVFSLILNFALGWLIIAYLINRKPKPKNNKVDA